VNLITGRTHQIRGQLSQLGFPIVGDDQYGGCARSVAMEQDEVDHREEDKLSSQEVNE